MKPLWIVVSLMSLAGISQAAELSGLQTTPTWNKNGDLTVTLTNWSKLEMSVDNVSATISDERGQPCQWKMTKATKVGPTERKIVVVADNDAVRKCLRGRKQFEQVKHPTLRFSSPLTVKTTGAPTVMIEADVKHRKTSQRASSTWSLERSSQ